MGRTYIVGEELKIGQIVHVKSGVIYRVRDEAIEDINTMQQVQALAQLVDAKVSPKRRKDGEVYINDESKKHIKARLLEYTFEELKLAIERFTQNRWRMEHNINKPLWWFFRSNNQIDTFLGLEQDMIKVEVTSTKTGKNWTQERLKQEVKEEVAKLDSPSRKKFDELRKNFKIGK